MGRQQRENNNWLELFEQSKRFLIDMNFKTEQVQQATATQVAIELEELAHLKSPRVGDPWSRPKARIRIAVAELLRVGMWKRDLHRGVERLIIKTLPKNQRHEAYITQAEAQKFYRSFPWRRMRYRVLLEYGRRCMCCGEDAAIIHVDHIKPLRKYWDLRLEFNNLQVLCGVCNQGKGIWDETDFRPQGAVAPIAT